MITTIPSGFNRQRNLTHVIPSLAASLGATMENTLGLPTASSAILLMVDGLGLEQLEQFSDHASFFRRTMQQKTADKTEMSTNYPSTTAAALSALGTELHDREHGIVNYDSYD